MSKRRFDCGRRTVHRLSSRGVGFTLIELLVVISIIALLISILLPALASAREAAKDLECSSRVRSMVLAWQLYAQDNADTPPYGFRGWSNWSVNQNFWWVELMEEYLNANWNGNYDSTSSFWRNYFCPSEGPREQPNPAARRWLGLNFYINPPPFNGFSEMEAPKLARFAHPSQTPVFLDSTSHITGVANNPTQAQSQSTFTYRHNNGTASNYAMADGSATMVQSIMPQSDDQDLDDQPGVRDAMPPADFYWRPNGDSGGYPSWNSWPYEQGYPKWPH